MSTVAIIPAAGLGARMGGERPKQFLDLKGEPLLAATLRPFQGSKRVDAVILVVPPEEEAYCRREIVERFRLDKVKRVVAGGARRQDSVRLGIEASEGGFEVVCIHDGARPLIDEALIERVIEAARRYGAATAGLPAKETVKELDSRGDMMRTYARENIWVIQTPQAFYYEDISRAHQKALAENWEEATDDSVLVEKLGIPVKVVKGLERNIKVTTPYDLDLARFLLDAGRLKSRAGEGT